MSGGYCLIDATGVNFTAEEATEVNGLYEKVYNAMDQNKEIIFCNIIGDSDDGLYTPISGVCILGENLITVNTCVKNFTISNEDSVTIL